MRTNFVKATLLVASLLFASTAFARDGVFFNLGAGVGFLSGMPSIKTVGATSRSVQNFPAWQASIGYLHDFYPSFGAGFEVGYGGFSKYRYDFPAGRLDTRSSELNFLVDFAAHLKKVDLILKIGAGRNTVDYTGLEKANRTRIQPVTELAVAYYLSPHYALQITGEHVFGTKVTSLIPAPYQAPSITALLFGVHIKFF